MVKWVMGIGVAVMLGMLGPGCSSSSGVQRQAVEQKRTYLLEAGMPAATAAHARFGAVKVRAFRGLPPFNSASLVVKRANGETVLDFYNAWVAPPHDLVRVQATRYLERAGLFSAVYDAASGTLASVGLEGSVCELYLDCRGEKPAAVITLRLMLLDERSADFTVLCASEKSARADYDPSREDGIAHAFNAALTKALEAIAAELGEKHSNARAF